MRAFTFENAGTYKGETVWFIYRNGAVFGELTRRYRRTYSARRTDGKIDRNAPPEWFLTYCGGGAEQYCDLDTGLTAPAAKRAAREHLSGNA